MKTTIETRTVTVGTASTQLLGPNPRRVGVIVSSPPTNAITLSWAGAAVLNEGVTLFPADSPWAMYSYQIGSALGQPVFAISDVAGQNVAVTEIIAAP